MSTAACQSIVMAMVERRVLAQMEAYENSVREWLDAYDAWWATLTKKQRRHHERLYNPPRGKVAGR